MTANNNFLKFLPAGEILDTALLFPGNRLLRLSSDCNESYISRRGEYFGLAMCFFMRPGQGPCILLSGSSCFSRRDRVGGWDVAWHPDVNNLGPHIVVTVVDGSSVDISNNIVYCQRFPVDLRSASNDELSIKSLEVEFFRGFGVDCWVNGQRIPSGGSAGSPNIFIDPGPGGKDGRRSCAIGGDIQGSLTRNKAAFNPAYQEIAGTESAWEIGNYLQGGVIWTLIERDRHPTQENNFPGAIMEFGVGAGIPLYDIDFTEIGGPRQVVEIDKNFTPNDKNNGFRWQDTNNEVFTDLEYRTDLTEVLVPLSITDENQPGVGPGFEIQGVAVNFGVNQ